MRQVVIWWDARGPGWAFDHYEVTLPGGDAFDEANGLPPDADIRALLRPLRKAVGSRGYVPHHWKWRQDADGRWVAPPKGA